MMRFTKLGAILAAASLAAACGTSTGGTSSGTVTGGTTGAWVTSGGTTGGGTTTSSSSGTTGTPECFGLQLSFGATDVLFQGTSEDDDVRANCASAIDALRASAVGATIPSVTGIIDNDSFAAGASAAYPITPGSCVDLGVSGDSAITSVPYTFPTTGTTVTAAVAGSSTTATVPLLVGVVTYAAAPYYSTKDMKEKSGSFYLEDPVDAGMPAPGSGIEVYFNAKQAANYPDSGIAIGDVVTVSDVKWSPYPTTGGVHVQNQFEANADTVVTVIGATPVPPAVPITADEIQPGASTATQYLGMRVTQTGPDTVTNICPAL
jgi:hypothetical protein